MWRFRGIVVWVGLLPVLIAGCGPSTTKTVGGRGTGGGAAGTGSKPASAPPDPIPTPPPEKTVPPATAPTGRPPAATPAEPAEPSARNNSEPGAGDESVERPSAPALAPRARPAEGFSGDVEPHRITEKFRALSDLRQGGALLATSDEDPNVDTFVVEGPPPAGDPDAFAVEARGFADPVLWHHPAIRHAVTGAAEDYDLPEGLTPIEEAGYTEDGFPWRVRCDVDGMLMGLVPAGPSFLGCDSGPENTQPQLGVVLEGFYIDLFEVTVAQYKQFRTGESTEKRRIQEPTGRSRGGNEPVAGVLWADARAYAQWAGKELPTEAEWEKGARGPDGFLVPWGVGIPLWPQPRRPGQITAVGLYPADLSPFGLYDTAGNVREWVADWYVEDYFRKLAGESKGPPRNPPGPRSQGNTDKRVVKGGAPDWLLCQRAGVAGNQRPEDVGFRCVARLKPKAKPRKGSRE